jgi:hypothetical protein
MAQSGEWFGCGYRPVCRFRRQERASTEADMVEVENSISLESSS